MNQERMDLLAAIYKNAKSYDNMDESYLVSDADGVIFDQFNIQYLEAKGLIELKPDKNKVYVVISTDGVDLIDEYLNSMEKIDRILLDVRIKNY